MLRRQKAHYVGNTVLKHNYMLGAISIAKLGLVDFDYVFDL